MVLKPLNNDEIEANGTDKWGFLSPFFQGECGIGGNNVPCMVFLGLRRPIAYSTKLCEILYIVNSRFQKKVYSTFGIKLPSNGL